MYVRRAVTSHLLEIASHNPSILITGPRQSGKTTLARICFPDLDYVSLEDLDFRESAEVDPRGFLAGFERGAVIDEIQRVPSLLSYLQTTIDDDRRLLLQTTKLRNQKNASKGRKWILTGSNQMSLHAGVTQSLAGRIGIVQLLPFSLSELQASQRINQKLSLEQFLFRGLYPDPSIAAHPPQDWYRDYFATYLERDVRQLQNIRDLSLFRTFVRMCAARTGQVLNYSALANDCGVSVNTAKGWISILEASYIVFSLPQHHVNFGKRLTKRHKLYFYDTGMAAWAAGIRSAEELSLHSMRGALFETWAVVETLKHSFNTGHSLALHYWRDQAGMEIDLILDRANKLTAIEFKSGKTLASDWLTSIGKYGAYAGEKLGKQALVYGGNQGHLRNNVTILPWRDYPKWLLNN